MNWLDKFLDEKLLKVAKNVEASYINHIVRIFEGKSEKFSSIDDALTDFSSRLGLSSLEFDSLKKQAMVKMAALGSCPKCGYGFAGRGKADSHGKREVLAPDAPKYNELSPCPGCAFEKNPSTSEKESKQVGFGEKYFVDILNDDIGYIGPFYNKQEASEVKEELHQLTNEQNKWSGWGDTFMADVITEREMSERRQDLSDNRLDAAKEYGINDPETLEAWKNTTPTITSPSRARNIYKENIEFWKNEHYKDQGEISDSNVASLKSKKRNILSKLSKSKTATTDLQKFQEEGITDPKAIRFMSKQKDKHTKNTDSPFALNSEEGDLIADEMFEFQKKKTNKDDEGQGNELSEVAVGKYTLEQLTKFAEEFGKILPFKEPSLEAVEELKKQLGPMDVDTPYKASRYGFNFVDANSEGFPKPGSPIKVKVYQYSYLKDELFKIINEDLRKHLSDELPFEAWLKFLEEQIKLETIPSSEGWGLIDKLKKMHLQLFGDQSSSPFFVDETKARGPEQVKKMLGWFPVSYQEKILKMLAEGKYRRILAKASGLPHSRIFPTSYARASFMLMDSFAPFVAIKPTLNKEQSVALIKAIIAKKQNKFTNEEFKALLQELQIPFKEVEAADEVQRLSLHERVKIDVGNAKNTNYKPLTLSKESVDLEDKEEVLAKLNDHLFSAINNGLPLAYVPQSDGSSKEMSLLDLGRTKQDLTSKKIKDKDSAGNPIEVDNPKAGLHSTFEGEVSHKREAPKGPYKKYETPPAQAVSQEMDLGLPPQEEPKSIDNADLLRNFRNRNKLKNISKVLQILTKYSSSGLWMDMNGKSYNSEEDLKKKMYEEMISESEAELINKVVSFALKEVQSTPKDAIPNKIPKPEEKEEDKLPLAAKLKLRALIKSTQNVDLKIKLAKVLSKTRE